LEAIAFPETTGRPWYLMYMRLKEERYGNGSETALAFKNSTN
jgi:hypothetical protein